MILADHTTHQYRTRISITSLTRSRDKHREVKWTVHAREVIKDLKIVVLKGKKYEYNDVYKMITTVTSSHWAVTSSQGIVTSSGEVVTSSCGDGEEINMIDK